MRPGVMVGSSVWVVSGRWVRLVMWCSACAASAGYVRCACWCGCVDVGGLSACLPVELVPALGGCLCARVGAVVCGGGGGGRCAGRWVGVVGCGCACGRVLGVNCGGSAGGRRVVAVRVAACVVWWCLAGVCSAWTVPVWVFGVGCWMWARRLRGVVGRVGGFSDMCGRLVAGVVGSVWAGWWWWLWLDCLLVVVSVGGPCGGPRVCDCVWACMVWWRDGVSLRVLPGVVPLGVWFAIT